MYLVLNLLLQQEEFALLSHLANAFMNIRSKSKVISFMKLVIIYDH